MKICTNRGAEMEENRIFCNNCGSSNPNTNNKIKNKFCKYCKEPININIKTCTNCGKKQNQYKGFKIFLLIMIVIIIVLSMINSNMDDLSTNFASVTNMTSEQENSALQIFKSCGIGKITSIEKFQTGETKTSYYMEDEETQYYGGISGTIVVWINNTTKEIEEIYFNDNDIYINGKVISLVNSHYVNSSERDTYRVSSQLLVKEILNNSNSAKFPSISGWNFEKDKDIIIVQSSVTSKNNFGVEKTLKFQVKYKSGKATSLILGGKEYIK